MAAQNATVEIVAKINANRAAARPPQSRLILGEVVETLVPPTPAQDIGFLLGFPATSTMEALKRLHLVKDEVTKLASTAAHAAIQAIYRRVWQPRREAVADLLDTRQKRSAAQQGVQRPTNGRRQMRTVHMEKPHDAWKRANILMRTEQYCQLVEPSWRS